MSTRRIETETWDDVKADLIDQGNRVLAGESFTDADYDDILGRVYRLAAATAAACPECQTGHVVHVSDRPDQVQYACSNRCGWDA
jgi:hypothetical protein